METLAWFCAGGLVVMLLDFLYRVILYIKNGSAS